GNREGTDRRNPVVTRLPLATALDPEAERAGTALYHRNADRLIEADPFGRITQRLGGARIDARPAERHPGHTLGDLELRRSRAARRLDACHAGGQRRSPARHPCPASWARRSFFSTLPI